MTTSLYQLFILPHSQSPDIHRREFILNSLLCGLVVLASLSFVFSLVTFFALASEYKVFSVSSSAGFLTVIVGLIVLSRRGYAVAASFIFVSLLMITSITMAALWGFWLAQAELLFALTIVIVAVLFSGRTAWPASLLVAVSVLVIAYLQTSGLLVPDTSWERSPVYMSDVIGYIIIFIVIGIVAWLVNLETGRSLARARHSERELIKERDNLERRVSERTHELEDLQLVRLMELQPFAEFGRIGASLVHEIANPLTAAILHLEELNKQQHSELVRQVQRNLLQLEKYLTAARKQIRRQSDLCSFAVGSELKQVIHLLEHRARKAQVSLEFYNVSRVQLYGDAVKFAQLCANIIANAIDASAGKHTVVTVQAIASDGTVTIAVTDHGTGITSQAMQHLFEPFYSTKKNARKGLGLGLALVRQYVENDFNGSIDVSSDTLSGTVFTITLKGQPRV